ncbi:hypothetical protein U14_02484 [Candidatus Moduliflexus flocculans]|uniref:Uncharacterized protein n=1 Tax=Candidatus Moduliflexus flocculans TaxID=1499966 RepID=A0A081BLH5_9BACT|nr:hypothetical protein U14_02484 [Candidatus Moduliflexus flocculans]
MRSWTRILTSLDEVPETFRAGFPPNAAFPYTILLPEDRLSFLQKRREHLLCMYDDQIVVMESGRDQVNVTPYKMQDILYLEHGRELLHSWVKIVSASGSSTVSFNTVTIRHFEPIFEKIRPKAITTAKEKDWSAFDYLSAVNYKFMNLGRQSVRTGEHVVGTVYQPDRCVRTVTLFHKTLLKQYATGHLSILTENELIVIRQTKRMKTGEQNIYGGIFLYIPLRQIQDLSFADDEKKSLRVMTVSLADKVKLSAEFARDNEELEAFQEACRDLKQANA